MLLYVGAKTKKNYFSHNYANTSVHNCNLYHILSNIPSYDPVLHIVQEYAVYPDYIDFLQQHAYVLAAEFAGDCLHQNTHENCKYETNINIHM